MLICYGFVGEKPRVERLEYSMDFYIYKCVYMCFLYSRYCSSILSFINQLFIFEGVLDHYSCDVIDHVHSLI